MDEKEEGEMAVVVVEKQRNQLHALNFHKETPNFRSLTQILRHFSVINKNPFGNLAFNEKINFAWIAFNVTGYDNLQVVVPLRLVWSNGK